MMEMLPEGAVRQKMSNDGFSQERIEEFLTINRSGAAPPQHSAAVRSSGAPPPPPPPSQQTTAPVPATSSVVVDEHFRKYVKMRDMLPAGAVRQKMITDGFAPGDIDAFLVGSVICLPQPAAVAVVRENGVSLASALASPPALKSVDRTPLPPKKISLMDEIQGGSKLKSVQKDDTRMKSPAIQGAGGLLGMLASEMSKRRFNMKVEHEDDDSDSSGFSDSDSESDED